MYHKCYLWMWGRSAFQSWNGRQFYKWWYNKTMKTCTKCNIEKQIEDFSPQGNGRRSVCRKCRTAEQKGRDYSKYKGKYKYTTEQRRAWNLKHKYGMTVSEYEKMLIDQNNKCKICQEVSDLVIDHNHKTGIVRGLLCHHCNTMLGLAKDSPQILEGAIAYLRSMP